MNLAAVVAAAGLSRRMGREKILLPLGASTILETVLATLQSAGVQSIAAVIREDLPEAAERAAAAGALPVVNAAPGEEMLVSIRLGLAALGPDPDAVFVWPADHPLVRVETVRMLAGRARVARALIPLHRERRGHPALVGRDLAREIERRDLPGGLRDLWRVRADAVDELETGDPGVLFNVDTAEEYETAKRILAQEKKGRDR
ncbi:MAG TPA: nucleotidyltransferase family protein [Thermoanaerobaculia bacterium]